MYSHRFSVVKLTQTDNRIFLYVENELSISTEVIGAYFLQDVSKQLMLNFKMIDIDIIGILTL